MRLAFRVLGIEVPRNKSLLANDVTEVYIDTKQEEAHNDWCCKWLERQRDEDGKCSIPIQLVPAGNGSTVTCQQGMEPNMSDGSGTTVRYCSQCHGKGTVPCEKSECPKKKGLLSRHPCPAGTCRKPCPTCRKTLSCKVSKDDGTFQQLTDFLKAKNGTANGRFELFCDKGGDVFPLERTENVVDSLHDRPGDYEFHIRCEACGDTGEVSCDKYNCTKGSTWGMCGAHMHNCTKPCTSCHLNPQGIRVWKDHYVTIYYREY